MEILIIPFQLTHIKMNLWIINCLPPTGVWALTELRESLKQENRGGQQFLGSLGSSDETLWPCKPSSQHSLHALLHKHAPTHVAKWLPPFQFRDGQFSRHGERGPIWTCWPLVADYCAYCIIGQSAFLQNEDGDHNSYSYNMARDTLDGKFDTSNISIYLY